MHRSLLEPGCIPSPTWTTAWNRETSLDGGLFVLFNFRQFQRSLQRICSCNHVVWREKPGNWRVLICHPSASKKSKWNQSLISESGERLPKIENQEAKSEILFRELHLLADVSVLFLERKRSERQSSSSWKYQRRKIDQKGNLHSHWGILFAEESTQKSQKAITSLMRRLCFIMGMKKTQGRSPVALV